MKNFKILKGKDSILWTYNNKVIYSQKILKLKKSNQRLSSNSNTYLTMMVYLKRLGIGK